jgi:hypothetical protein
LPLALLALLVVSSGCLGALVGDEPLSFAASKATVDDAALANTGYEHQETRKLELNRTFEVGGESRQVEVTNWAAVYTKSIEIDGVGEQQAATVAVLSTPEVNVLGRTINPVGEMDNDELVERVISEQGNVRNIEEVGSTTVTILGEETEVTKFSATITVDGQEVDGYVHLGKVTHDGDIVLVAGMYPRQLSGEEETVLELMGAVEH